MWSSVQAGCRLSKYRVCPVSGYTEEKERGKSGGLELALHGAHPPGE